MTENPAFRRIVEQRSIALDYLESSSDSADDARRKLLAILDDGRLDGPKCGKTTGNDGVENPPCNRPAGHHEAYCRDASHNHVFIASR